MHGKAIEHMKSVIESLILKLKLDSSGRVDIDSLVENFDDFSAVIDKHFKKDITPYGGATMLLSRLDYSLNKMSQAHDKCSLSEIITNEQISEITNDISSYLSSKPREYEFRLPLPKSMYKDFLSDRIGGKALSIQKAPLGFGEALQDKYHLVIKINGLLSGSTCDELYHKGIAKYKFIIQILLLLDVFALSTKTSGLLQISELQVSDPQLEVVDLSNNPLIGLHSSFNCKELSLVNSLELHQNIQGIGKIADRELALEGHLSIIESLLVQEDERIKRLITATSWLHESLISTNQTQSFINLCIALEALLGSEQSGDLTRTLRDRCSYLIGETLEDRHRISEEITKIYKARSNLVHGLDYRLSARDENLFERLKPLVMRVILKEFKVMLKSKKP